MAEATKMMPENPDVQLTLTWDEATELQMSLGRCSDSCAVYQALGDVLR